jgi:four helix bundle protein
VAPIRERGFQFVCDVFDYCDELERAGGIRRRLAWQLFDAGYGIGANLHEAKAAYSRREYAAKNSVSLKEARESEFWLRLAEAKSLGSPALRAHLTGECSELVAILTATVKRLQCG